MDCLARQLSGTGLNFISKPTRDGIIVGVICPTGSASTTIAICAMPAPEQIGEVVTRSYDTIGADIAILIHRDGPAIQLKQVAALVLPQRPLSTARPLPKRVHVVVVPPQLASSINNRVEFLWNGLVMKISFSRADYLGG